MEQKVFMLMLQEDFCRKKVQYFKSLLPINIIIQVVVDDWWIIACSINENNYGSIPPFFPLLTYLV